MPRIALPRFRSLHRRTPLDIEIHPCPLIGGSTPNVHRARRTARNDTALHEPTLWHLDRVHPARLAIRPVPLESGPSRGTPGAHPGNALLHCRGALSLHFDRSLWNTSFHHHDSPGWPCPTCARGTLEPDYSTFNDMEGALSRQARHEHPHDWEPDWITGVWAGFFRCSSPCGEVVAASGVSGVDFTPTPEGGDLTPIYVVTTLTPAVHLLVLPSTLPQPVREALLRSFELFWLNPSACAGKLRVALERYLDSVRIRKRMKTSKKTTGYRLPRLTLHQRIQLFHDARPANRELARSFLALKVFANEAVHTAALTRDDILDAYAILDSALPYMSGHRARATQLVDRTLRRHRR